MRTNLTRALAIVAGGLLLAIGPLTSVPASAATYTVSAHMDYNGLPDPYGHLVVYKYFPSSDLWAYSSNTATDSSGLAQVSVSGPQIYRFCFYSDSGTSPSEELCWGGDTVDQATTATVNSNLNLGTINLRAKTALNLSGIRILGKPVVGQRLTLDLSSLPAEINNSEIKWYRDGVVVGGSINGQRVSTGSFYTVKSSDAGHTITASVLAEGPRFASPIDVSGAPPHLTPALGPVVRPMHFNAAPKIKAKKWKKGNAASYVAPVVTPPGASATFQWLRNGKAIKGAKNATYKIKQADRKKKLTLRVTYTHSGYETTVRLSAPSPKVK
jgi:hypothetical protein